MLALCVGTCSDETTFVIVQQNNESAPSNITRKGNHHVYLADFSLRLVIDASVFSYSLLPRTIFQHQWHHLKIALI